MVTRTPVYLDFINGEVKEFNSGDAIDVTKATNVGVASFTELDDVPASYTGEALKVVRVNAGETALEFATISGGSGLSQAQVMARISIGF